jgi:predicted tellurium resistance membrane protein TerC
MLAEIAAAAPEVSTLLTHIIALVALTLMEIVLGIDNIVFISVVTSRLPEKDQPAARRIGLAAAMGTRILLLLTITWIMNLKHAAFTLDMLPFGPDWVKWLTDHTEINEISWKDLILVGGGLFLINSSVREIHAKMEGESHDQASIAPATFRGVIFQIAVLDIIFSLDSVITAVGMAEALWVMITAVVLAVAVMMVFSGMIARFVERHMTVKMLALSFLLLIGVTLVADGLGTEINKGYIYFAMGFALAVEVINLRARAKAKKRTKKETDGEPGFVD